MTNKIIFIVADDIHNNELTELSQSLSKIEGYTFILSDNRFTPMDKKAILDVLKQ